MLPFTLLAIAITKPGFFSVTSLLSRINEIPSLFVNIPYYLLFIIAVELVMRIGDFVQSVFYSSSATNVISGSETATGTME